MATKPMGRNVVLDLDAHWCPHSLKFLQVFEQVADRLVMRSDTVLGESPCPARTNIIFHADVVSFPPSSRLPPSKENIWKRGERRRVNAFAIAVTPPHAVHVDAGEDPELRRVLNVTGYPTILLWPRNTTLWSGGLLKFAGKRSRVNLLSWVEYHASSVRSPLAVDPPLLLPHPAEASRTNNNTTSLSANGNGTIRDNGSFAPTASSLESTTNMFCDVDSRRNNEHLSDEALEGPKQ